MADLSPVAPVRPGPPWPGVEHRQLAALVALADARSFRGAAHALGCSQSTLSGHVAQLERSAGRRLADRTRGSSRVRLTDDGERLLGHARAILDGFGAARADVRATAGGREALRIGLAEHLAAVVATRILPGLRRRRPELAVALSCLAAGEEHVAALRAGRVDVLVGDLPSEPGVLAFRRLTPEPYVLLAPAGWPVARRASASVADLLEQVPVALDGADPDVSRVLAELGAAGLPLRATSELRGCAAVVSAVLAGRTAALVPRSAAGDDPRLTVCGLGSLVAPRPTAVLWHGGRRRTEHLEALVDALAGERRPRSSGGVLRAA